MLDAGIFSAEGVVAAWVFLSMPADEVGNDDEDEGGADDDDGGDVNELEDNDVDDVVLAENGDDDDDEVAVFIAFVVVDDDDVVVVFAVVVAAAAAAAATVTAKVLAASGLLSLVTITGFTSSLGLEELFNFVGLMTLSGSEVVTTLMAGFVLIMGAAVVVTTSGLNTASEKYSQKEFFKKFINTYPVLVVHFVVKKS